VLAYYSVAAPQEFWTDHWGRHSVEELLAIARRSPLTGLITQALPDDGVILEAGFPDAGALARIADAEQAMVDADLRWPTAPHKVSSSTEVMPKSCAPAENSPLVENPPIGDHQDAIENLLVGSIVQAGQPVRKPRDAVGLAAAR